MNINKLRCGLWLVHSKPANQLLFQVLVDKALEVCAKRDRSAQASILLGRTAIHLKPEDEQGRYAVRTVRVLGKQLGWYIAAGGVREAAMAVADLLCRELDLGIPLADFLRELAAP